MTVVLCEQPMAVLPDSAARMYSGTDIASHSTGQQSRVSGQASDPDADWGYHETHGVDARTDKAWKIEQSLVRLRAAPDCRDPLRDPRGVRGHARLGVGTAHPRGDDPWDLRQDPGVG